MVGITSTQKEIVLADGSFLHIKHIENSGVNAGGGTISTWTARTINTIEANGIIGCSVNTSTGEITLPAGTYFLEGSFTTYNSGNTQIRLRNTTNNSTIGVSNSIVNSGTDNREIILSQKFTITSSTVFELQQWQSTTETNSFGSAISIGNEVYLDIMISMVSAGSAGFMNIFNMGNAGGVGYTGLTIENDAGDVNWDIKINPGKLYDWDNNDYIELTTPGIIKQLDATWSSGTNAGGRATLATALPTVVTMTGNFTTSGTTVTGSGGSNFDPEFNVGDYLWSSQAGHLTARKIESRTSDTAMTLVEAFPSNVTPARPVEKLVTPTWYHIFLLWDYPFTTIDAGFDTSLTASNLTVESSLPFYKRLGSVWVGRNNNIKPFIQTGNKFNWTSPIIDYDEAAANNTVKILTTPIGLRTLADINVYCSSVGVGFYDTTTPVTTWGSYLEQSGGAEGGRITGIPTNTSSQVREYASAAGNVIITTNGWLDYQL